MAVANVSTPHGAATKVATNVTSAQLFIKETEKYYWATHVATGAAAPAAPASPKVADGAGTLWVRIQSREDGKFGDPAASDIYIYCAGGQATTNGNMRVDT